jgi:hypothetical protein
MGIAEFVTGASLPVFLLMAGIPAAMVGIGAFVARRTQRQIRAIESTPAISPAAAAPGLANVVGVAAAVPGKPLTAPLTRSPCVWYQIRVEKWERASKQDSGNWRTLRAEQSEAPLLLRRDGAEIAVNPYGADVTPTDRSLWYGPRDVPDDNNPPRFKPWDNPKGKALQIEVAGTGERRYRFSEERIYAGDPLFVLGEIVERSPGTVDDEANDRDGDPRSGGAGRETPKSAAPTALSAVTSRFLLKKPTDGRSPFLMSTVEPSKHVAAQRAGVAGAWSVAAAGLVLLVLLIALRMA